MREIVKLRGEKSVSTLNGDISLNQNAGNLIVKRNGIELTRVDAQGFTYSEQNGIRRILIGAHPLDGHIVEAISDPGKDVINELQS